MLGEALVTFPNPLNCSGVSQTSIQWHHSGNLMRDINIPELHNRPCPVNTHKRGKLVNTLISSCAMSDAIVGCKCNAHHTGLSFDSTRRAVWKKKSKDHVFVLLLIFKYTATSAVHFVDPERNSHPLWSSRTVAWMQSLHWHQRGKDFQFRWTVPLPHVDETALKTRRHWTK